MATPRRGFLKPALLATGAGLHPGRTWAAEGGCASGGAAPKKVLIIGAGLSAFVAAHGLHQAGHMTE